MAFQTGHIIGKRYKIHKLSRTGSLHEYWKAFDTTLERYVILKFLRDDYEMNITSASVDPLRLFRRDASLLAQLEHPNVLPIYDIGKHENLLYVVTRDIEGLSLKEFIRDNNWSIFSIIQFATRLASAIDYIHTRNVIHGDINPNNVLIGLQEQPYLANFTMAAMREEFVRNKLSVYAGTNGFIAPEIILGETASSFSDLYSFGSVLFYCFTHSLPPSSSAGNIVQHPSIQDYQPQLPLGIDFVIKRLTNVLPQQRYPNATDAANDLSRVFYSGQGDIKGRVFISYATKDKDYVHRLANELRRLNIDIWIDQDIEKGSDWGDSIENALKETDIMLLILSEASVISEYVIHEWSFFMGLGKPIYPFILHSSPPKDIHSRLQRLQHIMGTDDMFNDVARIIDALAGGNPSRIQAET
jgi:serine/threonine protein kinase